MNDIFKDSEGFDSMDPIEDELDCVIMSDRDIESSLRDLDIINSPVEETEEDVLDSNIDYNDASHDPDMVDMDADLMIAADRAIMMDPFEDEELDDILAEDEEDIDLSEDEE